MNHEAAKMSPEPQLTANERELVYQQAIKIMRKRLEQLQPQPAHYVASSNKFAGWIELILNGSKAFIPVIAILAALASSVRTIQTAAEIYTLSGSHPIAVALAAICFTISVEGALFVLGLIAENQKVQARLDNKPRRVFTLKGVWEGILVRIGLREPLQYNQMEDRINLTLITLIASSFAVAANLYIGIQPLLGEIGASSLQSFLHGLWDAPAKLQLNFLVDMCAIAFPPAMAIVAGELTARLGSEVTLKSQSSKLTYESDLLEWQAAYNNPLEGADGQKLLETLTQEKSQAKQNRLVKQNGHVDFLAQSQSADS
jgi:hypothetical protein